MNEKNRKAIAMLCILVMAGAAFVMIAGTEGGNDNSEDDMLGLDGTFYLADAYVGAPYYEEVSFSNSGIALFGVDGKPAWLTVYWTAGQKVIGFGGTPTAPGTYTMKLTISTGLPKYYNVTFTVKNVTLSFDANGGSGTQESIMMPDASVPAILPVSTFTAPAGHVFAGWNTAANGTGTWYTEGSSAMFLKPTKFYAQWAPVSPPTAAFVPSVNGLTVTMSNTSVLADSYLWDFGDGGTSALKNPEHIYATAGTYSVSLTATGPGGSNTISKPITVSGVTTTPPVPSFSVSINEKVVQFTYTGTAASSYLWDFGDGKTSTQKNPSNIYDEAGTYTVGLAATNAGGTVTCTEDVTINLKEIQIIGEDDNENEDANQEDNYIDWILDNSPLIMFAVLFSVAMIFLVVRVIL